MLLNLYRDERDGVSWHSDDEPELGSEPVIGSLSLGATRTFQLRRKDYRRSGVPWEELSLTGGSLLVMRGSTQRLWQHRLAEADRPTLRRARQSQLPLDRTSRNVENSRSPSGGLPMHRASVRLHRLACKRLRACL